MEYTFEILGTAPILYFFNQQQEIVKKAPQLKVEYLGTDKCTLDALLESVEVVPAKQGWNLDQVVDTVINFWMKNADSIQYWKARLKDAGNESLLISRIADIKSLKAEFELLLNQDF